VYGNAQATQLKVRRFCTGNDLELSANYLHSWCQCQDMLYSNLHIRGDGQFYVSIKPRPCICGLGVHERDWNGNVLCEPCTDASVLRGNHGNQKAAYRPFLGAQASSKRFGGLL
jgi:hypothetical protein